jgi:hypothetical protein
MIGGLLTTVGSAVDAVRTNNSSQETQQSQSITDELKNEFHIHEDCNFTGVPGSVVCSDHVEGITDPAEEAVVLDEFRETLSNELSQVPKDQNARRRFAGDCVGMIAGEVVLLCAGRRK